MEFSPIDKKSFALLNLYYHYKSASFSQLSFVTSSDPLSLGEIAVPLLQAGYIVEAGITKSNSDNIVLSASYKITALGAAYIEHRLLTERKEKKAYYISVIALIISFLSFLNSFYDQILKTIFLLTGH